MKVQEKENTQPYTEEPLLVSGLDESLKEQITDTNLEEGDPFLQNLERRRWVMLVFVGLASYSNCGQWIQYMGIQKATKQYYHNATTAQVLWFGQAWTLLFPLLSYVSSFILHWDFKKALIMAEMLNFGCAVMRYFGGQDYTVALVGSFLAGAAQTFTLECPVFFAQTWFHAKERLMVVTILVQLTYLANGTLYMLSPWIVKDDYLKVEQVNLTHMIIAGIPFLMSLTCLKSKPARKPNLSAGIHKGTFSENIKQLFSNRQYLVATLMFGINIAHSYTICPAIEIIMADLHLQPTQIGILGFVYNIAGIISGLMACNFLNRQKIGSRHIVDKIIKGCVGVSFVLLLIFGLLCQFISSYPLMVAMAGVLGITMLASIPLCCTAIEELSFPVDENLAQNGLFFVGNLLSFFSCEVLGINGLPDWLKCNFLTLVYIPCVVYVVFFHKTQFKKSEREGRRHSSFN